MEVGKALYADLNELYVIIILPTSWHSLCWMDNPESMMVDRIFITISNENHKIFTPFGNSKIISMQQATEQSHGIRKEKYRYM